MHITNDGVGPRPLLRCTICDRSILTAAEAVVVYPMGVAAGEVLRVCVAHNGPCLEKGKSLMENDEGPPLCMELGQYLRQLMRGLTPVPGVRGLKR
jgi:hypothetical protein